jgi:hypothetical protein
MSSRRRYPVCQHAEVAWWLIAYCLRNAEPKRETSARQDFLINQTIRGIFRGENLQLLKDGDLFGSLLLDGSGCSGEFLDLLRDMRSWMRRWQRNTIPAYDALKLLSKRDWSLPPFTFQKSGPFSFVSTAAFEDIVRRRIRIPRRG